MDYDSPLKTAISYLLESQVSFFAFLDDPLEIRIETYQEEGMISTIISDLFDSQRIRDICSKQGFLFESALD